MAGDTDRRPFRASNSEIGSKPGGTESALCEKMYREDCDKHSPKGCIFVVFKHHEED